MPPESPYQSTLRPEDFAARPGFKISIVSLLVYLVGIAVHFFVLGGRQIIMAGGPTAGVAIGGYVGIFLLAVLISFLGFAFVPSRLAATIVFCLSIPALIFGGIKVNELANARIHPETVKAPTPKPKPGAPAAVAEAPEAGNPPYNTTQRGTYIDQVGTTFINMRAAKTQAYIAASSAYATAASAGFGPLTSKEAIAARRKVVADTGQVNQEYMDFVRSQEAIYRSELEKTPLIPNDVNVAVGRFKARNPFIGDALAARVAQRNALKAYDDEMVMLDQSFGRWKVAAGRFTFKPADNEVFGKLQERYKAAADLQSSTLLKVQTEQKALAEGATPEEAAAKAGGTVDPPTPPGSAVSPAPAGGVASPAPAVGAVPAASPVTAEATAPPAPGVAPAAASPIP